MKKKVLLLLQLASIVAVLAGVIVFPSTASAEVPSHVWLNSAYKGQDSFFDRDSVVAYVAGSTATLKVAIQNDTDNPMNIKGVKVKFGWTGGEYAAATGGYPSSLAVDQTGEATITFTVPDTSVASNTMEQPYEIKVDFDNAKGFRTGTAVVRQGCVRVDAATHKWRLGSGHTNINPASLSVWWGGIKRSAAEYTLDPIGGYIYFVAATAPAGTESVTADYEYGIELVATGDGHETEFRLAHSPVVTGTQTIYLAPWDSVNSRYTAIPVASTDYSLDTETGKITFTTAPGSTVKILAYYQYYGRWTATAAGNNFVVYSTDQGAARGVREQLVAMGFPTVNTTKSKEIKARASMEYQLAELDWAAGNFAEAKTNYDLALKDLKDALKSDRDSNDFDSNDPMGNLLRGIGYLIGGIGVILAVVVWVVFGRKPAAS